MSNPFVLWGVIFGVVLGLVYFGWRLRRGKERNVEDVVGVCSYGLGIFSGVQVCWLAYEFRSVAPIDKTSVQRFFGGFALVMFAVNKIVKKFRDE